MAKNTKKTTRKFEKNQLKGLLDKRKEQKKGKQRHQLNEKKKAKRAKRHAADSDSDAAPPTMSGALEVKKPKQADAFASMTVDEFFQGGFNVPELKNKHKKAAQEILESNKSESKKRKRTEVDTEGPESEDSGSDMEASEDSDSLEIDQVADEDDSDMSEAEDFESHKVELEALASKDPEFFKYLQENDKELLEFGSDDELVLSEDEEPARGPEKKDKKEKKAVDASSDEETSDSSSLDLATVRKWRAALQEQNSLRAMKEVALAFKAAVHVNDSTTKNFKYKITTPEVYHELLVVALELLPTVLQHHLPLNETATGKVKITNNSKKFQSLSPMIKSHSSAVQTLLAGLSDPATMKTTLNSVLSLLPYMLSLKKFLRGMVKTIVEIWSDPSTEEATRITAFLCIRRLVVIGDIGIKEAVLKSAYQGLVSGSRKTSPHTIQAINLMKNTGAELWGLDDNAGYMSGFGFIRQLAIHLRSSITNVTKESYKQIYNWQYVHSLDFWSRVVSLYCDGLREAQAGKESALRPLIYPIVQITLGAMRLIPTAQYFPLRFQLMRSLLRISRTTGTYIPLSSALIEVLQSKELRNAPKSSTLRPLDFSVIIRCPKTYLHTRTYQDGVGEEVTELFAEYFVIWAKSIAFPELLLPVSVILKRWLKEASRPGGNKNGKLNSALSLLVQKLVANATWIEERRAKVDFAPNDREQVAMFLRDEEWEKTPLGAYVVTQRKLKEAREKVLEKAGREKPVHDEMEEEE